MRKPAFCICENKVADQCAVIVHLISAFAFAIRIVQSLYYLNPKFQTSSHLLWLYSLVCVGLGRKPRRPIFSQRGSNYCRRICILTHTSKNGAINCRLIFVLALGVIPRAQITLSVQCICVVVFLFCSYKRHHTHS